MPSWKQSKVTWDVVTCYATAMTLSVAHSDHSACVVQHLHTAAPASVQCTDVYDQQHTSPVAPAQNRKFCLFCVVCMVGLCHWFSDVSTLHSVAPSMWVACKVCFAWSISYRSK